MNCEDCGDIPAPRGRGSVQETMVELSVLARGDMDQLDLFRSEGDVKSGLTSRSGTLNEDLPLVWSKMEAEFGEGLHSIILRKEIERLAGGGMFFWGIGNPIRMPPGMDGSEQVPVLFSRMISPPKDIDLNPSAVVVWRAYFDPSGRKIELPPHTLVVSRAFTSKRLKRNHYALVCRLYEALSLRPRRPFDPSAYRNAGGKGGQIGYSQVTALVRRVKQESLDAKYSVDMQAVSIFPFIVRLADGGLILPSDLPLARECPGSTEEWLRVVAMIRSRATALDSGTGSKPKRVRHAGSTSQSTTLPFMT